MDTRIKVALEGISIVSTMKKDIYVAHVHGHTEHQNSKKT